MWLVLSLAKQVTMESAHNPAEWQREMKLTWADGMVGALPVFDSQEAALAYADGRYQVVRLEMGRPADMTEQ